MNGYKLAKSSNVLYLLKFGAFSELVDTWGSEEIKLNTNKVQYSWETVRTETPFYLLVEPSCDHHCSRIYTAIHYERFPGRAFSSHSILNKTPL